MFPDDLSVAIVSMTDYQQYNGLKNKAFYVLSPKSPRGVTRVSLGSLKFLALPSSRALLSPAVRANLCHSRSSRWEAGERMHSHHLKDLARQWQPSLLLTFNWQGVGHLAPLNCKRSRTHSPHTQLSGLWERENNFRWKIAVRITPS